MNLPFFETSAKDNKNINEAFYTVTRLALQKRLENRSTLDLTSSKPIRLKASNKKDKKRHGMCCK
jgi:GTPase SAR1 family protein